MFEQSDLSLNHTICLELLDEFLRICSKYNINYFFAFGSCLGAVRSNGFIPWDINIDVLLMKSEFDKLDEAMKKELKDNEVFEWCIPEVGARMYPLLRKKGSWDNNRTKPNIDVSVYKNAPNNRFLRRLVIAIAFFNRKMYKLKNTKVSRRFPFNILKLFSSLFPNSAYFFVLKKLENLSCKDSVYSFVLQPSVWKDKETIKSSWTDEDPIIKKFENRDVRVFRNFDEYLTNRYGNYMKPEVWDEKGTFRFSKEG